jgi:hypothetical protein
MMAAGLALAIASLSATGPLISLRALPWWWSAAEVGCSLLSIAFLALTHLGDPGIIPRSLAPDPLIAQLDASAALVRSSSMTLTVQSGEEVYKLSRLEHVWLRMCPGVTATLLQSCILLFCFFFACFDHTLRCQACLQMVTHFNVCSYWATLLL